MSEETNDQKGANAIREAILEGIAARSELDGRTISPEDAARAVSEKHWRKLLTEVRLEAVRLAREDKIAIYRKGKPVDPDDFKGVYRLGPPMTDI